MLGPALGSQKSCTELQDGGRVVGKLPGEKDPGLGSGQQLLNMSQCLPRQPVTVVVINSLQLPV